MYKKAIKTYLLSMMADITIVGYIFITFFKPDLINSHP